MTSYEFILGTIQIAMDMIEFALAGLGLTTLVIMFLTEEEEEKC